VSERNFQALEEYQSVFSFKYRATWQTGISQDLFDSVYSACVEQHQLVLDYQSNYDDNKKEFAKRILGPEKIYFADSSVYLIAKDLNENKIKTYNLHRARSAEMVPDKTYEPENIKIEDYFKNSFGVLNSGEVFDVHLFITQPMANYVAERRWHDSQSIVRTPDGIQFKMTVRVNDEVARWVLSLSPCAEVIFPEVLKERVVNLITQDLQKYQKKQAS
jgi:predicted DNA-binding transcriptional regulator YafY